MGRSIIIVGAGISGLSAALRIHDTDPAVHIRVLEASSQPGGVLQTDVTDGFVLELGADSFISNKPEGLALCERLGLKDDLAQTDDRYRRTYVVSRGQLVPVPAGFQIMVPTQLWPVLRSPILSLAGKLRLLAERFVPRRRDTGDESLESFARRRLGGEVFERLVQPLAAGIYTADANLLSLLATLPRFIEMEQKAGSLLKARQPAGSGGGDSGARYSLFVTPRHGFRSLIDKIITELPAETVRLNTPVERIERKDDGSYSVRLDAGEELACDGVILAVPGTVASRLVRDIDSTLSSRIAEIPYAGAAIVTLVYDRSQVRHPLEGFGVVVPDIEKRDLLAASFSSVKFPCRAPEDKVVIRAFVGGARRANLLEKTDEELRLLAHEELASLLGIRGQWQMCRVNRWSGQMPQYHLGHLDRVAEIDQRVSTIPGLALAGNAYHGVGIPDCIRSGWDTAATILAQLKNETADSTAAS
jgi:oxygen-dependent protoporphyrinogen oxidase